MVIYSNCYKRYHLTGVRVKRRINLLFVDLKNTTKYYNLAANVKSCCSTAWKSFTLFSTRSSFYRIVVRRILVVAGGVGHHGPLTASVQSFFD